MEKLFLKINGTCYDVSVGDLSACPVEVTVNGTVYFVDVEGMTTSQPAIVSQRAPVAAAPQSVRTVVPSPVAATAPAAETGGNVMQAPMPGIIHNVMVKPGDKVTAGQQVFALEAMKMKSALRVTRGGIVASVEVTEGQRVTHGQVLLRFE